MFHNIPDEMKRHRQWIVWRLEWQQDDYQRLKKPTKVPYQITGERASVTDAKTWFGFDEVLTAGPFNVKEPVDYGTPISQTGFSGIGFVLTKFDEYTIIDLDFTDNPEWYTQQLEIFKNFLSYAERSQSGKGCHIIVKARLPGHGRRRNAVEIYDNERYMAMTGDVLNDRNLPINNCQNMAETLWAEMVRPGSTQDVFHDGQSPEKESDDVIIRRAAEATNGPKFKKLFNAEWQDVGYTSQSEADFALIDIVAFYTQNAKQIARIFRASELGKRDKAARDNYVGPMIRRAFDKLPPPLDIETQQSILQFQMDQNEIRQRNELDARRAEAAKNNTEAQQLMLPNMKDVIEDTTYLQKPPPGLLGEIVQFIFHSSPTPCKEIALAGAIGLLSGITGRCFNISGTGLNHYVLALAPTGSGKEAIATGISKIMGAINKANPQFDASFFIGPGNIRSDAALLKALSKQPSFVSIVGEFGIRLKQLSSEYASPHEQGLRATILDLYNKSGEGKTLGSMAYSDKEKNVGEVVSPAFTMIGESTPERFYENLDESMIYEGLLPRFTIVEYVGQQPELNKGHNNYVPSPDFINRFGALVAQCFALNKNGNQLNTPAIRHVQTSPQADEELSEIQKFARQQTNQAGQEIMKQLWSRVHVKVMKLAALCAVGRDYIDPVISSDDVAWAKSIVVTDVTRVLKRFSRGEVGKDSEESRQENAVKKACFEYVKFGWNDIQKYCQGKDARALHGGSLITHTYIARRIGAMAAFRKDPRGVTIALKRAIENLCHADILREVPPSEVAKFGTRARCYMCNDFDALET